MESLDGYMQALNRLLEQNLIDAKPSLISLKQGEIVFHAEEPARHIFGIQTGKVQLVRYLESGQMSNQYALQSGAWFGEDALFNTDYQNSAIAIQPTQAIVVPKHSFLTLLQKEPDISLAFIQQLTKQLYTAKDLMTLRCIRSAHERVLAYLYDLKISESQTCFLDCSIKEIAEKICLAPEVVSRSLRKLQDDGIIERNQRKIIFLKR
ncbi:MAG: Crp/Fnr family transcriptional regulator [Leptolyngbya sp. SIO3F4]|nr:Crp/Fnr family transcriptional regulator [Leptolyngbya sp. SIO3F4]